MFPFFIFFSFFFFFFFLHRVPHLLKRKYLPLRRVPHLLKTIGLLVKLWGWVKINACLCRAKRGWVRAKRADLSTGYPQALRRSLRPRAKRAPPSYYSPHKKKECLRRPLSASYIPLNKLFFERSEKKLSTGYPQVIHTLRASLRPF